MGPSGIAVGMATNIPPHNLTEVVNRSHCAGEGPQRRFGRGVEARAGAGLPDRRLPLRQEWDSAGLQNGPRALHDAGQGGYGKLTKEKLAIIVTEIPYQVNKSKLIERMPSW